MVDLKSLKSRIAIAHYEREQMRHERECARSRVLVGAYGLSHLDAPSHSD
jgi:hypothetical protein